MRWWKRWRNRQSPDAVTWRIVKQTKNRTCFEVTSRRYGTRRFWVYNEPISLGRDR